MIVAEQREGRALSTWIPWPPQSQPQPPEAMDAEWVELSTIPIGPLPPQCQARLYIIGTLLTRSHSRSSVDSFDALSLATTYPGLLISLDSTSLQFSTATAVLIG